MPNLVTFNPMEG